MDLLRLCRLCLKCSDYHSNMFTEIISDIHLYQLINNICELRVFRNDGLPEHICIDCFQSIKGIFSFKSRVKEAETALMRMKRNRNVIFINQDEAVEEVKDNEESAHSAYDHSSLHVNQIFIKEEPIESTETSLEDQRLSDVQLTDSQVSDRSIQAEVNISSYPESICKVEMILPDDSEETNMTFRENLDGITKMKSFDENVSLRNMDSFNEEVDAHRNPIAERENEAGDLSEVNIKDEIDIEEMSIQEKVRNMKEKEAYVSMRHFNEEIISAEKCASKEHLQSEGCSRVLQCHHCGVRSATKEELAQHIEEAHTFLFTDDDKSHQQQSEMLAHEKAFKCTECNYRCGAKGDLKRHLLTHTGEKPFQCTECSYSCSRSTHLKVHMLIHTGEKPFQCTQCTYSCSRIAHLRLHMAKHTGVKPFHCGVCSYSTSQSGSLKLHMLKHTGVKPYQCSLCTYSCSQSGSLKIHMFNHAGVKPFRCTVCDYGCTQSGTLKKHMYTHTGEKPFKCALCTYSCSASGDLRKHMLRHTGEKPFKCTECPYSSSEGWLIKRHMLTHTGEKPFQCTVCNNKFSLRAALKRHMLTHSGEKVL